MVLLLRRNLVKEKEGAWRRRIYRKYASCKWLKDAGLEFTRADVVVSISRGPPGQWFSEIEHWTSAIFGVTSGIPPKIIYRSVKSYSLRFSDMRRERHNFLLCWLFVHRQLSTHWLNQRAGIPKTPTGIASASSENQLLCPSPKLN